MASWGPPLAVAVSGPIESLRRFFDAGNISVWVVLSAPVFALGSGYLAAYVGRRFWAAGDASRPTSHTLPPLLAIGIAVLLVILPAWQPVFLRRFIGRELIFFFCFATFGHLRGGSVGVLTYWLRKKSTEQCLRPFNIIEAGVLGVAALSPLLAFRTSIYVVMGSPVKNASWSWDFAIAVWFFCVISAAAVQDCCCAGRKLEQDLTQLR